MIDIKIKTNSKNKFFKLTKLNYELFIILDMNHYKKVNNNNNKF